MAAAFQQQIFALDARFNSYRAPNHPNFRTLYIRRRSQLLRENSKFKRVGFFCSLAARRFETTSGFRLSGVRAKLQKKQTPDIETIQKYLSLRCQLLQRKYGAHDNTSLSSSGSRHRASKTSLLADEAGARWDRRQGVSVAENYAFSGVHHIYDQHTAPVSVLKFANNDRSLLCCAAHDGRVSICDVTAAPPAVTHLLPAHADRVTGCDWSASNEQLVTSSADGSLCLWAVRGREARCLRRVRDQLGSAVLCCVFQPANNNMVIAGNARGMVEVLNVSTGIYPKGGSSILGGQVLSLACDSSGRMFWAANDKGVVVSYRADTATGCLSKLRRCVVGGAVTCLSWSPWVARRPALLLNSADNSLCLFRVVDRDGSLQVRRVFRNAHAQLPLRSAFCPIMSLRREACVVTASEDSSVYFLDTEQPDERAVVNKLQGHASPVLGVSFSYDESLLASSDTQGLVIIWRRS